MISNFLNKIDGKNTARTLSAAVLVIYGASFLDKTLSIALTIMTMLLFRGVISRELERSLTNFTLHKFAALIILVILLASAPFSPPDDGLRHATGYVHGYSLASMYPYSTAPDFQLYPLFDIVVGAISLNYGKFQAIQIVSLTQLIWLLLLVWAILKKSSVSFGPGAYFISTILVFCFIPKIASARPDMFPLLWGASILACDTRQKRIIWLSSAPIFSAAYWLFPVYSIFAFLAPGVSVRSKILGFLVLLVIHVSTWIAMGYSIDQQILIIDLLRSWSENRIIGVSENRNIAYALTRIEFSVMFFVAVYGALKYRKDFFSRSSAPYLMVTGWFTASSMVRYAPHVALLIFSFSGRVIKEIDLISSRSKTVSLIVLIVPFFIFKLIAGALKPAGSLPEFVVPDGSVVMTSFNVSTFAIPYANNGTVGTLPAMEIGASPKYIQAAAIKIATGSIDCQALKEIPATHLVENELIGKPLPCLRLEETRQHWRLWSIHHRE